MSRARRRPPTLAAAAALIALALAAAAAQPFAAHEHQAPGAPGEQAPAARFRASVTYVEVDAAVIDGAGRFVPGLRREDFTLLEDGQPRSISAFSFVDLPIRAEAGPASPPSDDTRTNEEARPGRLYVVVLDDLHTSPQHTPRARAVLRRFVEDYVGPSDLVAMLSTGAANRIVVDFTSSRETLLGAVDRFMGRRPPWLPPSGGAASQVACFT